jgi:hypothetical protein
MYNAASILRTHTASCYGLIMQHTESGHQVPSERRHGSAFFARPGPKGLETNAATKKDADARLKVCPLVPVGLRQVLAVRTLRRDSPIQVKPVNAVDQPIEHGIGDGGFTVPGCVRGDGCARGGA